MRAPLAVYNTAQHRTRTLRTDGGDIIEWVLKFLCGRPEHGCLGQAQRLHPVRAGGERAGGERAGGERAGVGGGGVGVVVTTKLLSAAASLSV
jgi:hypothetical protein